MEPTNETFGGFSVGTVKNVVSTIFVGTFDFGSNSKVYKSNDIGLNWSISNSGLGIASVHTFATIDSVIMDISQLKFKFKNIKWLLLIGFIISNVIFYNHAYKFTHFTEGNGKRIKPENLTTAERIKVLFFGVDNPKPLNDKVPPREYSTIRIKSHVELEGWLIEEESQKGIVILFHGYSGSKSSNITYGEEFNKKGYTTLLVDFMGSGGSGGNQTTLGVKESRDVKESYDFVKQKYPGEEIILFGSSMGAVSIMKSILDYDLKPDKIILECPFGSMKTTIRKRFEAMNVPSFPFAEILLFYGGVQNGFNGFKHNPTEYAKSIMIPTLLFYGINDKRVTISEIATIFENLKGDKELRVLKESGHENYLLNDDEDWIESVGRFIKK